MIFFSTPQPRLLFRVCLVNIKSSNNSSSQNSEISSPPSHTHKRCWNKLFTYQSVVFISTSTFESWKVIKSENSAISYQRFNQCWEISVKSTSKRRSMLYSCADFTFSRITPIGLNKTFWFSEPNFHSYQIAMTINLWESVIPSRTTKINSSFKGCHFILLACSLEWSSRHQTSSPRAPWKLMLASSAWRNELKLNNLSSKLWSFWYLIF